MPIQYWLNSVIELIKNKIGTIENEINSLPDQSDELADIEFKFEKMLKKIAQTEIAVNQAKSVAYNKTYILEQGIKQIKEQSVIDTSKWNSKFSTAKNDIDSSYV